MFKVENWKRHAVTAPLRRNGLNVFYDAAEMSPLTWMQRLARWLTKNKEPYARSFVLRRTAYRGAPEAAGEECFVRDKSTFIRVNADGSIEGIESTKGPVVHFSFPCRPLREPLLKHLAAAGRIEKGRARPGDPELLLEFLLEPS
jgi:hypothetical protein